MNIITTTKTLAVIFLLLFVSCKQVEVKDKSKQFEVKDKPNILWIVSEDNSPFLGCYGDKFATTPNIDKFAKQGSLYKNAFANTPVCSPARSTLLTGMYASSMGTIHMRSRYEIPKFIKPYPVYLKEIGYYCSNRSKTDFNIKMNDKSVWDESGGEASYKKRKPGQPFFHIHNIGTSHESCLHKRSKNLKHDPKKVNLPAYHPDTVEIRKDWAQYYDKVESMDRTVGECLAELEAEGLADSTIVFYYSDHGGALARSKRFLFDSGTHVPCVIRFPKKFKHLAPTKAGGQTDRLISFVDFAPTLLSLVGVKVPDYMQGSAFLGAQNGSEKEYAFLHRNRMDERFESQRACRDKQFKYIKNYMPQRIYGQYLQYLWRAAATKSWEAEYKAGRCNKAQSHFWQTKPSEELYDIHKDPNEVNNLALDPKYKKTLIRMRKATLSWMLEVRDVCLIPEGQQQRRSLNSTAYEFGHDKNYPLKDIVNMANKATSATESDLSDLIKGLDHKDPSVRYWSAIGCVILKKKAMPAKNKLKSKTNDKDADVRIAVAEALLFLGDRKNSLRLFEKECDNQTDMTALSAINMMDLYSDKSKQEFKKLKINRNSYLKRVVEYRKK